MKTLKTLFTLLLMMVSMAVSAQTIVAVEKTDGTTDNYNLADVDSVVYEPAEEVKYYYYAGWTCPKNLTELAEYASKSAEDGNGTSFIAGSTNTVSGWTNSNPLLSIDNTLTNSSKAYWYVVIPNGIKIYDVTLPNDPITDASFTKVTTTNIEGYNIYQFNDSSRKITGIQLYN